MPKYKVHVCRASYSHLDIEVEAPNAVMAEVAAEQEAPNWLFPSGNSCTYDAQGCTEIN